MPESSNAVGTGLFLATTGISQCLAKKKIRLAGDILKHAVVI
jgi:hypothetical protein